MSRKNISILATMMMSLLAAGASFAQDAESDSIDRDRGGERGKGMPNRGQRGPMDPERSIRMMTRRLDLDETQTQQIRNIYLAAEPDFTSLREQGRANREAMRDLNAEDADDEKKQALSREREGIAATATALRERIRTEIDAVLTAEQREKFAAAAERGRERGQRSRHRGQEKPQA